MLFVSTSLVFTTMITLLLATGSSSVLSVYLPSSASSGISGGGSSALSSAPVRHIGNTIGRTALRPTTSTSFDFIDSSPFSNSDSRMTSDRLASKTPRFSFGYVNEAYALPPIPVQKISDSESFLPQASKPQLPFMPVDNIDDLISKGFDNDGSSLLLTPRLRSRLNHVEDNVAQYLKSISSIVMNCVNTRFTNPSTPYIVTNMFRVGTGIVNIFDYQYRSVHQSTLVAQKYAGTFSPEGVGSLVHFEAEQKHILDLVERMTFRQDIPVSKLKQAIVGEWFTYHGVDISSDMGKIHWVTDVTDVAAFKPEEFARYLNTIWEEVVRPWGNPMVKLQFEELMRLCAQDMQFEYQNGQPPSIQTSSLVWNRALKAEPSRNLDSDIRQIQAIGKQFVDPEGNVLLDQEMKFLAYKTAQRVMEFLDQREGIMAQTLSSKTEFSGSDMQAFSNFRQLRRAVEFITLSDPENFTKFTSTDRVVQSPRPFYHYTAKYLEDSPTAVDVDSIVNALGFTADSLASYLANLCSLGGEDRTFMIYMKTLTGRVLTAMKGLSAQSLPSGLNLNNFEAESVSVVTDKLSYRKSFEFLSDLNNIKESIENYHLNNANFTRKLAYEVYKMFASEATDHSDIEAFLIKYTLHNTIEPHVFLTEENISPAFEPAGLENFLVLLVRFVTKYHPNMVSKLSQVLMKVHLSTLVRTRFYPTSEIQLLIDFTEMKRTWNYDPKLVSVTNPLLEGLF